MKKLIIALTLIAILFTGCVVKVDPQTGNGSAPPAPPKSEVKDGEVPTVKIPAGDPAPAQGEAQLKSEDEIKKIALEWVDGATEKDIRKIKKDLDDGRWEYEVEIIYNKTEYELEINAVTGEVITWDKESIYD